MARNSEYRLVAIDLGTTNSRLAWCEAGEAQCLWEGRGSRSIPSDILFDEAEHCIGQTARERRAEVANDQKMLAERSKHACVIYDLKRLLGRSAQEAQVQEWSRTWPFEVRYDGECRPCLVAAKVYGTEGEHRPEELQAMYLAKLIENAVARMGQRVRQAVFAVPATFTQEQHAAMSAVAELAGVQPMGFIYEPAAVALHYIAEHRPGKAEAKGRVPINLDADQTMLVYDFGGGTLDLCLLKRQGHRLTIRANAGDGNLGGNDFDLQLLRHCLVRIERKHPEILDSAERELLRVLGEDGLMKALCQKYPRDFQQLRCRCERVKHEVSQEHEAGLMYELGDFEGCLKITRATFEHECRDLLERSLKPLDEILNEAKSLFQITKDDVDVVIMSGGTSAMPCVIAAVRAYFPPHVQLVRFGTPDEAVALGSVWYANQLGDLGSDEDMPRLQINDHVPISLGVAISDDDFVKILSVGTRLPVTATRIYATSAAQQMFFVTKIMAQDRPVADGLRHLGDLRVGNIPRRPAGEVQLRLTFSMGINGVLTVSGAILTMTEGIWRLNGQYERVSFVDVTGKYLAI